MLYVVKRDGRTVEFNIDKISNAIKKAATEEGVSLKTSQVFDCVQKVINYIEMTEKKSISVVAMKISLYPIQLIEMREQRLEKLNLI